VRTSVTENHQRSLQSLAGFSKFFGDLAAYWPGFYGNMDERYPEFPRNFRKVR
jgi:hypothetical protein